MAEAAKPRPASPDHISATNFLPIRSSRILRYSPAAALTEPFGRDVEMQMVHMTQYERAAQIWSVLAWSATNRQELTYDITGRLIGVPARGLGRFSRIAWFANCRRSPCSW